MAPRLALADAARKNVASIAQLVERNLAKVEVTSSNLVTRSKHFKGLAGVAEMAYCSGFANCPWIRFRLRDPPPNLFKLVARGGEKFGKHKRILKIPRLETAVPVQSRGPGHHFPNLFFVPRCSSHCQNGHHTGIHAHQALAYPCG